MTRGNHQMGMRMIRSPAVRLFAVAALLACSVGPSYAEVPTGAVRGVPDTVVEAPSGVVPDGPDTADCGAEAAAPDSVEPGESVVPRPDRVTVHYFHRTLRCDTCLRFEAYTEEAIRSEYADELEGGALEWNVVNLDEPGNEHYVDDFFITESSVVAVEFIDGEQQDWANLDAIWGLVGDKPTFLSYIRSEVEARLGRLPAPEPFPGDATKSSPEPEKHQEANLEDAGRVLP